MRLPDYWIDQLFGRLSVRYGAAFLAQYRDLDIDAVKADWAGLLGAYADKPECIKQALDWLPTDRPPNAGQFRALCREAIPRLPQQPRLSGPGSAPADPERVRELIDSVMRKPHDKRTLNQQLLAGLYAMRGGGGRLSGAQREAIVLCEAYENRGGPAI